MQGTLFPNQLSSPNLPKNQFSLGAPRLPKLSHAERQIIGGHLRTRAAERGLSIETATGLHREADRFCNCGTQFFMFKCPNERLLFRSQRSCNSRICETCGRRYANRLEPSIEELFRPLMAKKVRGFGLFFLTITTSTNRFGPTGPSRADIKRFYQESTAFLRLHYGRYLCKINQKGKVVECQKRRGRKPRLRPRKNGTGTIADFRKFRGAGYLASLELGSNANMIHAHAIVYGPYIPQKKLSQSWLKLTGDSFIVDIRAVRSPKKAARYVLKYISKPPQTDSLYQVASYATAIKGTRRIRTGGIFFNRIRKKITEPLKNDCPYCGQPLHYAGEETILDLEAHTSLPLYPLLREVDKRGSPLPPPEGATTTAQRWTDEVLAKSRQLFAGCELPGKSFS